MRATAFRQLHEILLQITPVSVAHLALMLPHIISCLTPDTLYSINRYYYILH